MPLLARRFADQGVRDEGVVPASVELLLVIVNDVRVQVVETLLPGLVFAKERIGGMFPDGPHCQADVVFLFEDAAVEQEVAEARGIIPRLPGNCRAGR